jgi:hypothetical protein
VLSGGRRLNSPPHGIVAPSCACNTDGDLHILVVASDTGRLFHTMRRNIDGNWTDFVDVQNAVGTALLRD